MTPFGTLSSVAEDIFVVNSNNIKLVMALGFSLKKKSEERLFVPDRLVIDAMKRNVFSPLDFLRFISSSIDEISISFPSSFSGVRDHFDKSCFGMDTLFK